MSSSKGGFYRQAERAGRQLNFLSQGCRPGKPICGNISLEVDQRVDRFRVRIHQNASTNRSRLSCQAPRFSQVVDNFGRFFFSTVLIRQADVEQEVDDQKRRPFVYRRDQHPPEPPVMLMPRKANMQKRRSSCGPSSFDISFKSLFLPLDSGSSAEQLFRSAIRWNCIGILMW
jgi:hypothetical protein